MAGDFVFIFGLFAVVVFSPFNDGRQLSPSVSVQPTTENWLELPVKSLANIVSSPSLTKSANTVVGNKKSFVRKESLILSNPKPSNEKVDHLLSFAHQNKPENGQALASENEYKNSIDSVNYVEDQQERMNEDRLLEQQDMLSYMPTEGSSHKMKNSSFNDVVSGTGRSSFLHYAKLSSPHKNHVVNKTYFTPVTQREKGLKRFEELFLKNGAQYDGVNIYKETPKDAEEFENLDTAPILTDGTKRDDSNSQMEAEMEALQLKMEKLKKKMNKSKNGRQSWVNKAFGKLSHGHKIDSSDMKNLMYKLKTQVMSEDDSIDGADVEKTESSFDEEKSTSEAPVDDKLKILLAEQEKIPPPPSSKEKRPPKDDEELITVKPTAKPGDELPPPADIKPPKPPSIEKRPKPGDEQPPQTLVDTLPPVTSGSTMFFSYDDGTPNGPSSWQRLNGRWTCEGRKQSPININTNTVIQDQIAKNIIIKQFPPHVPLSGIIKNNGHAPTFSLTEGVAVRLSGGTLLNDFYMKQIHFHFGCTEKTGSEHFIDGVQFPLEMHLVFWDNSTYSTFSQAAKGDNGIAVVAILFQREDITGSQPEDLTPLHQITGLLKNIRAEGEGLVITEDFGVQFDQLVPSIKDRQKADRVFIYSGSLSTPGCYESVTWMVYANTPHVTNKQLQEFRQLRSTKVNREGTMCDNYRPLQKTFGRKIYSNII